MVMAQFANVILAIVLAGSMAGANVTREVTRARTISMMVLVAD